VHLNTNFIDLWPESCFRLTPNPGFKTKIIRIYMNKNDYYHIFKTQFENHPGARSESQVRRVNSGWTNFFLIMTTSFWPKKSSGFFTRVNSCFFTRSNKVIPSSIIFRERLEMRANLRFQKNQIFFYVLDRFDVLILKIIF